MPGLRGTPAGITTRCAPYSASPSCCGPVCAVTCAAVEMCDRSPATPAVLATSYRRSSRTREDLGECMDRDGRRVRHAEGRGLPPGTTVLSLGGGAGPLAGTLTA